jgi:hypothetical protein
VVEGRGTAYSREVIVSAVVGSGNLGEEMLVEGPGMLCNVREPKL